MFIRRGTPCVFKMMSTGVPSERNGMSSCGRILEMTPLLPWRPASLSPSLIFRLWATETRMSPFTPGGGAPALAALLAEDRPQQPLLGGQLGLALGRDLADQDVAGDDLGTDADDAALVEVGEDLLGDVRDVPGDLLGTELGVAGVDLVLLDVDRGEDVVLHQALAED